MLLYDRILNTQLNHGLGSLVDNIVKIACTKLLCIISLSCSVSLMMMPSAFAQEPSALGDKPSALGDKPSALGDEPSAIEQPSDPDQEGEITDTGSDINVPAAESKTAIARPYLPPEMQRMQSIAAEIENQDYVLWLQAKGKNFLALNQPQNTANGRGAVILLHDEGSHPNWPNSINSLRSSLPNYGWHTLAISLPDSEDMAATSQGEEMTKGVGSSTTAMVQEKPAHIIINRINAAYQYLNEQAEFNIVLLGEGVGAGWAAQYLSQSQSERTSGNSKKIQALIVINPRTPASEPTINFSQILAQQKLPILEIATTGSPNDKRQAEQRRVNFRHANKNNYRQIRLPKYTVGQAGNNNLLSKRVRVWLEKFAPGYTKNTMPAN